MFVSEILEELNYCITGGSQYTWSCFGPNARYLDFETDYGNVSIVFDSKTKLVYEATANDTQDNFRYNYVDSQFKSLYLEECKVNNVDPNIAWDNKTYTKLECEKDFINKASAIMSNHEFDTRINVPINLDEDEIFYLCLKAHEQDITLNQLVENILQEAINKHNA